MQEVISNLIPLLGVLAAILAVALLVYAVGHSHLRREEKNRSKSEAPRRMRAQFGDINEEWWYTTRWPG